MTDNFSSLVAKPHLIKLTGEANYRTWAKDIEMVLIRMGCWEVTTEALPVVANRTGDWKKKDNWARSEIHLACSPDQQELILDSETAHASWEILKNEYARKGELKKQRLKKEFASVKMTEPKCAEYINKVRKLVSELKGCGETLSDPDIAYTTLMGLGDKFSSLVVTLTNMATETSPLSFSRVVESILTEEMRLVQSGVIKVVDLSVKADKDPNESNPLAYKSDTSFKGELQHAMVARTQYQPTYRQSPYQRGSYQGRGGYRGGRGGYSGVSQRGGYTSNLNVVVQPNVAKQMPVHDIRSLPWGEAPWQPRLRTANEERADVTMQSESRQCYGCGGWGHIRKHCYHKHPELHPANREWLNQRLAQMDETVNRETSGTNKPATQAIGWKPNEEASVMMIRGGGATNADDEEEHPFEMNMIMEEVESVEAVVSSSGSVPVVSEIVAFTVESTPVDTGLYEVNGELLLPVAEQVRRWLLDSGASSHYVRDEEKFLTYDLLAKPIVIKTGNGPIYAVAKGDVLLQLERGKLLLRGVLWVPDLAVDADLISVPALMKDGFTVNFGAGVADIMKDSVVWGNAKPLRAGGSLCYVREYHGTDNYACAMKCTDTQTLKVWHRRMGHLNARAIKSMAEKVTGLRIGVPSTRIGERNVDCVDCLKGSQHQSISRYPYTPAMQPLERVSMDIAGPMRVPDCTWNYKHIFVLIDHYTRHIWVFPIISRDMALKAFNIWRINVEKRLNGNKVVTLQSDNAGEFIGKKWTKMCHDEGIEHITTAPYGPSMNAFAERVIRTLVEHASSMLYHANLKEEFWALAIKASAYLINRSPHSSLENNATPYEMWHKVKPGIGHIRIWGCRAWAAVPKDRRTKFDSKTKECILVGFYDTESLYQLWDVEGKQLIKRRDVIFQEHVMGHPSLEKERQGDALKQNILGTDRVVDEEAVVDTDDLEDLYPVIESLKADDWSGVPIEYLPLQEGLLSESFPRTYKQAVSGEDKDNWLSAMDLEYAAMRKNGVFKWSEVPRDTTFKPLPSKWIFQIKRKVGGEIDKFKARIVAGGHKQKEGDFRETFAPVAKFVSLRILLTLAALDDLEVEQVDIVTAFLHGTLDEELYMKAPDGITPRVGDIVLNPDGSETIINEENLHAMGNLVWKLVKSLYGLKQAPRCFYKKLDEVLKSGHFQRVPADWGVWVLSGKVVILVHVDDMFVMGSKALVEEVIDKLSSSFPLKRLGPAGKELFLGLQMRRDRAKKQFVISQANYAKQVLIRYGMEQCAECDTPMERGLDWAIKDGDVVLDNHAVKVYQGAIGSLIYLVLGSRPDLAYSVNKLAQYSSKPTRRHWNGVKRIFRFLRGSIELGLVLGEREVTSVMKTAMGRSLVIGFFDAAFMDDKSDRHSTMGYAFYVKGSLVSWCSRKQRTVALSTTEAEYLAGTEATKEAIWVQVFLSALGLPEESFLPAILFGDNQGANALLKNPEYHSRTKHIHGRQRFITEMWESGKIDVQYIPTSGMIADTLTKALPREPYWNCVTLLGLSITELVLAMMEFSIACRKCQGKFETKNRLHRHLRLGCSLEAARVCN
ncbi:MAG: RNA-dependent polymerase [Marmoricola sp.]|nr:RNA-dependent polymerase [Marmoricola sp.]